MWVYLVGSGIDFADCILYSFVAFHNLRERDFDHAYLPALYFSRETHAQLRQRNCPEPPSGETQNSINLAFVDSKMIASST